jgi:hypothetical protein
MSKDNETWWVFDEAVPVGKKLKAENVVVDPTTKKKYMVYDGEPKDMIKFMSSIENVKDKGHWASPGNFSSPNVPERNAPKPPSNVPPSSNAPPAPKATPKAPAPAPKAPAPKEPAPKEPAPKPASEKSLANILKERREGLKKVQKSNRPPNFPAQEGKGRKVKRVSKYKWKKKKTNKK